MKTIKYDPVDFMDDSEDMLAYLCEITETGDPEMIANALELLETNGKLQSWLKLAAENNKEDSAVSCDEV